MKIQLSELMDFLIRYNQNRYPHERLGQAFINHMISGVQDSNLFYEENRKIAISKIMDKYIEDLGKNEKDNPN